MRKHTNNALPREELSPPETKEGIIPLKIVDAAYKYLTDQLTPYPQTSNAHPGPPKEAEQTFENDNISGSSKRLKRLFTTLERRFIRRFIGSGLLPPLELITLTSTQSSPCPKATPCTTDIWGYPVIAVPSPEGSFRFSEVFATWVSAPALVLGNLIQYLKTLANPALGFYPEVCRVNFESGIIAVTMGFFLALKAASLNHEEIQGILHSSINYFKDDPDIFATRLYTAYQRAVRLRQRTQERLHDDPQVYNSLKALFTYFTNLPTSDKSRRALRSDKMSATSPGDPSSYRGSQQEYEDLQPAFKSLELLWNTPNLGRTSRKHALWAAILITSAAYRSQLYELSEIVSDLNEKLKIQYDLQGLSKELTRPILRALRATIVAGSLMAVPTLASQFPIPSYLDTASKVILTISKNLHWLLISVAVAANVIYYTKIYSRPKNKIKKIQKR